MATWGVSVGKVVNWLGGMEGLVLWHTGHLPSGPMQGGGGGLQNLVLAKSYHEGLQNPGLTLIPSQPLSEGWMGGWVRA